MGQTAVFLGLLILAQYSQVIGQLNNASHESPLALQRTVLDAMSLYHGLTSWESGNVGMQLRDRLRAKPVEYVPEIEKIVEGLLLIVKDKNTASPERLKKLGISEEIAEELLNPKYSSLSSLDLLSRAVSILYVANPPSAYDRVGKLFVEIDELLGKEKRTNRYHDRWGQLDRFQTGILSTLGDREDRRVVNVILNRLPKMKYYDRGPYYLYLHKAAVGNEEVIQKLKAMAQDKENPLHYHTPNGGDLVSGQVMAQDKENPLHDHGYLLRTIDALSGKSAKTNQLVDQLMKEHYDNTDSPLYQDAGLKNVIEKLSKTSK